MLDDRLRDHARRLLCELAVWLLLACAGSLPFYLMGGENWRSPDGSESHAEPRTEPLPTYSELRPPHD